MTFAEVAARFYKCLASGQQGSNRDLWVMRLHTSGFLTFGIFENERILIAVGYRKENNVPKIREKECFPESALISKSLCSPASLSAADSRFPTCTPAAFGKGSPESACPKGKSVELSSPRRPTWIQASYILAIAGPPYPSGLRSAQQRSFVYSSHGPNPGVLPVCSLPGTLPAA